MGSVNVPPVVKSVPLAVNATDPSELRITLPVVELPRVRGGIFVVPRFPFPSRYVATPAIVPEILAVGTPLETPMKANLAEAVESDPMRRSTVLFFG